MFRFLALSKRCTMAVVGIFAFVMTLLVLDISAPQIASSHYNIGSVAAETELLNRLSSSKAEN